MEIEHYDFIKKEFKPKAGKLQLLGDVGSSEPCSDDGIFDPVGGDLETFRDCRNLIISELDRSLRSLRLSGIAGRLAAGRLDAAERKEVDDHRASSPSQ